MLDPGSLQAGNLAVLLWTALALGLLHTVLGPDHYLPFVMMARAQNWSRRRLTTVVLACGVGHVASTLVIGAILIAVGTAVSTWTATRWAALHEVRGSITAWLLIGVGVAFLLWGIRRAVRGQKHSHMHAHPDGTTHDHEHEHRRAHTHAHETDVKRITPWVLFVIFVFGPCESLVPLMLATWALAGWAGTLAVAAAFALTTIVTMLAMSIVLMTGIQRIPLGKADRWSVALAGLSLVLCGAGIQWLGL